MCLSADPHTLLVSPCSTSLNSDTTLRASPSSGCASRCARSRLLLSRHPSLKLPSRSSGSSGSARKVRLGGTTLSPFTGASLSLGPCPPLELADALTSCSTSLPLDNHECVAAVLRPCPSLTRTWCTQDAVHRLYRLWPSRSPPARPGTHLPRADVRALLEGACPLQRPGHLRRLQLMLFRASYSPYHRPTRPPDTSSFLIPSPIPPSRSNST